MKAPNLKDLHKSKPQDAFTKKVQAAQTKAEEMKRKTYSLPQQHLDYIHALAMRMGQEQGKVVSASEALRFIIDQHSGKQS